MVITFSPTEERDPLFFHTLKALTVGRNASTNVHTIREHSVLNKAAV